MLSFTAGLVGGELFDHEVLRLLSDSTSATLQGCQLRRFLRIPAGAQNSASIVASSSFTRRARSSSARDSSSSPAWNSKKNITSESACLSEATGSEPSWARESSKSLSSFCSGRLPSLSKDKPASTEEADRLRRPRD